MQNEAGFSHDGIIKKASELLRRSWAFGPCHLGTLDVSPSRSCVLDSQTCRLCHF